MLLWMEDRSNIALFHEHARALHEWAVEQGNDDLVSRADHMLACTSVAAWDALGE